MKTISVRSNVMMSGKAEKIVKKAKPTGRALFEEIRVFKETGASIIGGAPKIYSERSQGVLPGTNIREDKWSIKQSIKEERSAGAIKRRNGEIEENEEGKEEGKEGKEDEVTGAIS